MNDFKTLEMATLNELLGDWLEWCDGRFRTRVIPKEMRVETQMFREGVWVPAGDLSGIPFFSALIDKAREGYVKAQVGKSTSCLLAGDGVHPENRGI